MSTKGLIATVYPSYFKTHSGFGPYTNCFTFLTGFDEQFIESLQVSALRPETLGWTNLKSVEEWIRVVTEYFSPKQTPSQSGSVASYLGLNFDYPSVKAICWPKIEKAKDYHWAVFNGTYWLEQAGQGGPLNIWEDMESMMENVYSRKNEYGELFYIKGSAFIFDKKI